MAGLNIVKSVESVASTISSYSLNVSLTKGQVTENCVPFMTTMMGSDMDGYQNRYFLDVTITGSVSDPHIVMSRYSNGSTCYNQAYVVEFDPAEIKVQTGSFSISSGANEGFATISGVNINKSMLICRYSTTETSRGLDAHSVRYRFSDSDTIQFYRGATGGSISGHYYVVEDLNDNFDVSHHTWAMSSSTYSPEFSTTHNLNNTLFLGSYYFDGTDENPQHNCAMLWCRTDFTCYIQRVGTGNNVYASIQRIRFNVPDTVRMVMRLHALISNSDYDYDWNIGGIYGDYNVNLDTSMVHNPMIQGMGYYYDTNSSYYECMYTRHTLTDSNSIHIQRGQYNYNTYFSTEVIDWAGYVTRSGTAPATKIPELENVDSMVKSIEHVDFTYTNQWYDYVLTKGQDINNCVPFLSQKVSGSTVSTIVPDVYFVAPDIMRIAHYGYSQHWVKGAIVEFEPDQVRVQQGEFYTSSNEALPTISGVDLTKAALKFYYQMNYDSYFDYNTHIRGRFTTASGLQFYRGSSSGAMLGHYYVFEALDDQFFVQSGLGTMSSSSWASAAAITKRAFRHRSFTLLSSYHDGTDQNPQHNMWRGSTLGRHYLAVNRQGTGGNHYMSWFIVTLKEKDRTIFCQRVTPYLANGSYSTTASLAHNINPATSIINNPNYLSAGQYQDTNSGYYNRIFINNNITNSGTLTFERYANNYDAYYMLEAIDFIGSTVVSGSSPAVTDRSLIKSFEAFDFTHWSDYHILQPTKGQNLDNCVPFMTSYSSSTGGYIYRARPEVFFSDNMIHLKTITDAGDRYVALYLVEFNPSRVKIQQGFYFLPSTLSTTVAIEEVDLGKAFLIHNWHNDSSNRSWTYHLIRGKFNSSTELLFDRGLAGTTTMGCWWVVESLDDAFEVTAADVSSSSSTPSASQALLDYDINKNMVVYSYKKDSNTDSNPQHSAYRGYLQHIPPSRIFYFNRQSSSTTSYFTVYFIKFGDNEDVFVQHRNTVSMSGGTYSIDYDIVPVDTSRAMSFSSSSFCNSREDDSSSNYSEKCFHRYKISTDGTKVECRTVNQSVNAYGAYQVVQWPAQENKKIDGYVTENTLPVARNLFMYDRSTGALVGTATSDASTGYYEISTSVSGEHFVVVLDDAEGESFNALIADKLVPEDLV